MRGAAVRAVIALNFIFAPGTAGRRQVRTNSFLPKKISPFPPERIASATNRLPRSVWGRRLRSETAVFLKEK
jgi:hypothetical protein